jgi:hypothetical protein
VAQQIDANQLCRVFDHNTEIANTSRSPMSTPTVDEAAKVFADPASYTMSRGCTRR